MENEKIGTVTLNYEFYSGQDSYSDGDREEERLLAIAKECFEDPSKSLEDYVISDNEWPVLYHFSQIRRNLLRWYDFPPAACETKPLSQSSLQGRPDQESPAVGSSDQESPAVGRPDQERSEGEQISKGDRCLSSPGVSILEIGAGCGAITGLLCERAGLVRAIDLSRRRSLINAYRNNCSNLEIIVGNFDQIDIPDKFDYVTLIGVLEYSISYISSPDPFAEMLRRSRSFLKPGGGLIVAIENKYGLKYWAGAKEDHTGRAFDSIEGYQGEERVRTFSKKGLQELLALSGFRDQKFYYPVPDYKLPLEIYSDRYLPRSGDIVGTAPSYDRDRYVVFNEEMAFSSICEDGMFDQFANSFLVIAR